MRTAQDRGSRRHPIRIAHFAASLPVGGMENVLAMLLRHAPDTRYRSEAWCLDAADQLGAELSAEGRQVVVFGRTRPRQPSLFAAIGGRLRTGRIDVLHCHDELSWFYGAIGAAVSPRTRVVLTAHGRRPNIGRRHLIEQRVLARCTASIVAVSERIKSQLVEQLRLAPERVQVILNAIPDAPGPRTDARRREARRRLGLPADAIVIGTVGELSAVKHLDLALDAVARAHAALPSLRYVLVGDGALGGALRDTAAGLGLGDVVTFAGVRRDVADLIPAFDLYLCSSHYEGTSLSILEALQQATPVVATAVGGNPQIVRDGDTGLLVPAGDAEAMQAALVRLGRDDGLRRRLGERAAAFVARGFQLSSMVAAYEGVWRRALHLDETPRNAAATIAAAGVEGA